MANTLALKRRIKTAQNVSKTTKAMQMIAASKLKKAQEATLASRPYVEKLTAISRNMAPKTVNLNNPETHPYMRIANEPKTLYIIISPDKGLCGGLITNLVREYLKHKQENQALFITIGKKIETTVAANNKNLLASFAFGKTLPSFSLVLPVVKIIDEYFLSGQINSVRIITTHFNSVFSQIPTVIELLPITLNDWDGKDNSPFSQTLIEPNKAELLPVLLKRYLEMTLFQHFLESYASEQAARMLAMQNATNNAKDIVSTLKLLYNKARQEKITNEILDISSATIAMAAQN